MLPINWTAYGSGCKSGTWQTLRIRERAIIGRCLVKYLWLRKIGNGSIEPSSSRRAKFIGAEKRVSVVCHRRSCRDEKTVVDLHLCVFFSFVGVSARETKCMSE